MQNKVEALVNELFEKLNIKTDSIEVINVDKPNIFNIKIKTEESGLLIGLHGKTFDAIQNVLKLMCSNKI
ncbi:KH domain-containing protein [Patescibacteria group bacterium]